MPHVLCQMLPIFLSVAIDYISEAILLVQNGLESKKDRQVCDSQIVRTEQTQCMYQDTYMYIACTGQYAVTHLSFAQGNTGDTRVHVTLSLNDSGSIPKGMSKRETWWPSFKGQHSYEGMEQPWAQRSLGWFWAPERTKVKPQDCLVLAWTGELSVLKMCPNQYVFLLLAKFLGRFYFLDPTTSLFFFLSSLNNVFIWVERKEVSAFKKLPYIRHC